MPKDKPHTHFCIHCVCVIRTRWYNVLFSRRTWRVDGHGKRFYTRKSRVRLSDRRNVGWRVVDCCPWKVNAHTTGRRITRHDVIESLENARYTVLTYFRETSIGRPAGPRPEDSFSQTVKTHAATGPSPPPANPVVTVRSRPLGPNTHLMINRNMAQKHMSTARTDSMFENSATDTSIAVMATNMVAAARTNLTLRLRPSGIAVEGWRRHRKTVFRGLRRV